MRASTHIFLLCLLGTVSANAASFVFTDEDAWMSSAGSFAFDNFASATQGGPQPAYVSHTGVTLRRSLVSEDNAQLRTTNIAYNGDTTVSGPPYQFMSSSNQVFVFPQPPNENSFAGAHDSFNRRRGWEQFTTTRYPDMAVRSTRNEYRNHVFESRSVVTGDFDSPVTAFGFRYVAFAGPWPGSLELQVNGELLSIPVMPVPSWELFFGIQSTEAISSFQLSAVRGQHVNSSERFSDRPCGFGPPGEPLPPGAFGICMANGSIQNTFSTVSSSLTAFMAGVGNRMPTVAPSAVATPEPSTALLVLAALPLWILRRRR